MRGMRGLHVGSAVVRMMRMVGVRRQRTVAVALILGTLVGTAWAYTTGSRAGLQIPDIGEANWGTPLNYSLGRLDALACFPGVANACNLNLSTDTAATPLPLAKLTDDDTLAGRCLLSGGAGADPAYGPCTGGAAMASFIVSGDSGSPQTVTDNDTVYVQGGTGTTTAAVSGDTIRVDIATTEVGTTTWGTGAAHTWSWATGGTSVTADFLSGRVDWTAATAFNINGSPATTAANTQTLTNKTLDGANNKLQTRRSASNCPGLTDGVVGEQCWQQSDNALYICKPDVGGASSTLCDQAGDWQLTTGGGGGGGGDITDVWSATTGNVNALTAASGDTFDAGAAGSSKVCKRGTLAARPGTCADGDCYFITDVGTASTLGGARTFDCENAAWVQRPVGATASTNNAIATFSGTSGKLIQSTGCTVSGSNLTCPGQGVFSSTTAAAALAGSTTVAGSGVAVVAAFLQTDDTNAGDRTVGISIQGQSNSNDADTISNLYLPALTAPNGSVTENGIEIAGNYDYGIASGSRIFVSTPTGVQAIQITSTEANAVAATTNAATADAVAITLNPASNAATNDLAGVRSTTAATADATDTVSAFRAPNVSTGNSTNYGLYVGTGYDYGLYVSDGVPARLGNCTLNAGIIDCDPSATVGGTLMLREPSSIGTDVFRIKVSDSTGLASSPTHTINANGTLPATAIATAVPGDVGKLARFSNTTGILEAVTTPTTCGAGDAARGIDTAGNATGCFTPSGGGGGGGGVSLHGFGTGMPLTAGTATTYMGLGLLTDATENVVQVPVGAVTMRNLRCAASATTGGSGIAVTARRGSCGSQTDDATLQVTLTTANAVVSDTDSITYSAGDCLDFKVVRTATTTAAAITCSVEFSGTNTVLGFGSGMQLAAGSTSTYAGLGLLSDSNESIVQVPVPTSSYKNLRCVCNAAPGGTGIKIIGRVGTCGALADDTSVSSDGILTVTCTAANTTVTDTTNTMAATAGQCIDFKMTTQATTAAASVGCTVERTQ